MKILKSIGVALAAILLCVNFTSCEKEPILTLSLQGITSPSSGNSTNVIVNANNPWTVSGSNWCTISPSSGENGEVSVTVKVRENTTYDARNCTLTFTSAGLTQSISVNQESNYGVVLPKNTFELPSDAHSLEVKLQTNVDLEVIISGNANNWISYVATKALSDVVLVFNIKENTTQEERYGIVSLIHKNSAGVQDEIKIKQAKAKDNSSLENPQNGGDYNWNDNPSLENPQNGGDYNW